MVNGHSIRSGRPGQSHRPERHHDVGRLQGQPANAFTPGFPGFGPISAAQTLAYIADMQEVGVPVTYGYISDAHEKKSAAGCQTGCSNSGTAQGPGDPCYEANLEAYNDAFALFFKRLADDGINKSNTLFVISPKRATISPAPMRTASSSPPARALRSAGRTSTPASYPSGQLGEMQVGIHGLLQNQLNNTTPFYNEPQGNSIFITGNPGPNDPVTRQLERDFANATANDVYDGASRRTSRNTRPIRLSSNSCTSSTQTRTGRRRSPCSRSRTTSSRPGRRTAAAPRLVGVNQSNAWDKCISTNNGFAWDHGYYAPEIDNTWLGLVGPGVAHKGVDGLTAAQGPNSDGTANSNPKLVTSISSTGTWADHTDTRPTIMALIGPQGRLRRRRARPHRGLDDQAGPDRRQDVQVARRLLQAAQLQRGPVRHGRARRRHRRAEDRLRRGATTRRIRTCCPRSRAWAQIVTPWPRRSRTTSSTLRSTTPRSRTGTRK